MADRRAHDAARGEECDGLVTAEAGLPLYIFTADCAPVLMCDPDAGVIAAVHCGWRSTAADILGNAVAAMEALGASAGNIRSRLGPAIGGLLLRDRGRRRLGLHGAPRRGRGRGPYPAG